jgi:hypothetical protein
MVYIFSFIIGLIFVIFPHKFILVINKISGGSPKDFKAAIGIRMIGFFLIASTIIYFFKK